MIFIYTNKYKSSFEFFFGFPLIFAINSWKRNLRINQSSDIDFNTAAPILVAPTEISIILFLIFRSCVDSLTFSVMISFRYPQYFQLLVGLYRISVNVSREIGCFWILWCEKYETIYVYSIDESNQFEFMKNTFIRLKFNIPKLNSLQVLS